MSIIEWIINNALSILTLIVALITLLFTIKSYKLNKKRKKDDIKREIALKEAQLNAMESIHYGIDHTTGSNMRVECAKLSNEIEQLKRLL